MTNELHIDSAAIQNSNGKDDKSERARYQHSHLREMAEQIRKIYADSEVKLNEASQLHKLLGRVDDLSDKWAKGLSEAVERTYDALHVQRISRAIDVLSSETKSKRQKYLKDLLRGTLIFSERGQSHAKSILWELEVCDKIRRSIPNTKLEEPDVIVGMEGLEIAIPCKKIFSEKKVPNKISDAVSQFEGRFDFGIVAVNIEELLPPDFLRQASTFREAGDRLHQVNVEFLAAHQRDFKKYLSSSRIIGVIVSTCAIFEITEQRPRYNNFSEWAIWTTPELLPRHADAIEFFRKNVFGG